MRNDDVYLQIYLIRHAESMGNIETDERFDIMNPPLTQHGGMQAEAVAERMSAIKLDAVYLSPLERAVSTALPISSACGATVRFEPLLCEKDVCLTFKGFSFKSETDSECAERAKDFIGMLKDKHKSGRIAVVSHGEFLQFLLREIMGISDSDIRFCFYNASVSKINLREDKPGKVAFQNDISHLQLIDGDKTDWM